MADRRRTTLNLDVGLVAEAQRILGASGATETIHRALQDIVDRECRRQLLAMGSGDLTPQQLEAVRRNRTFEVADTLGRT